jgi:hypothetical protein
MTMVSTPNAANWRPPPIVLKVSPSSVRGVTREMTSSRDLRESPR